MRKATFCSLIIIVLQLSNFISGQIPARERAALIALYNSTNGDSWRNNTGWKIPPLHTDGFAIPGSEQTWYGVNISAKHVIAISLRNNKLSGTIPAQLGNLTRLWQIFLDYNQLSGSIPPELGNLSNLNFFFAYSNQLSGNIPPELGNLSNLQGLVLGVNQLSGEIPSQLANLSKLEKLYLDNNQLNGNIPPALGNLGKLKELWLHNNQLSGGIPSQLATMSNMQFLKLSNNRLGGNIPPELGNLSLLRWLWLNNNQLGGAIPSSFMNLTLINNLDLGYNCLYAADLALRVWLNINDPDWDANQNQCEGIASRIILNRSQLNFGYMIPDGIPPTLQTVLISNNGGGELNWRASANAAWLGFTPTSGTGDSAISVGINTNNLAIGDYTGFIEISDANAVNSPQTINVSLHVYEQGKTSAPFGEFATPLDGSSVYNSIPVTGWVLDDIEVANVKIYSGDTYIGDAVLVEGARPDVELLYPGYPNNYKAGWGYMLLTNYFPNGGDGPCTLMAKATDIEGNEITLGSKAITIDNAHAIKPFGAIDTPTQGGAASGKSFVNFGWALTPQPNMIPVDGSMIDVVIDGVVKGHPRYNIFRSDIAALFPGYANTNGAVGYYYLDTTKLSNGVHTIAWTVTDSAGNSDGIGSRYFAVQDFNKSFDQTFSKVWPPAGLNSRRGAPACAPIFDSCAPVLDETKIVEIKELERVEINLSGAGVLEGYSVVGDQLRGLPIGSTLDKERGVFYWQPGPGFLGTYRFMFIETDQEGNITRKVVQVDIMPKFRYRMMEKKS